MKNKTTIASIIFLVVVFSALYLNSQRDRTLPVQNIPPSNEISGTTTSPAIISTSSQVTLSSATLIGKKWAWVNTTYSDNKIVTPHSVDRFSITFNKDESFSVTTDCNGAGGKYTISGNQLAFGPMMSTLMYCTNSQESDFTQMLSEVSNFAQNPDNSIILNFKDSSASMLFR